LSEQTRILKALHASIIKSTGKQSDGLVSRYLNRPISRSISSVLLRFRSVRPIHATGLAALTGVLMAISLLFGGSEGLILGAFLFQAASVIDGVDGEMARATLRSSDFGAKLDTVTDGLTNLAFVAFASLNLWWQGERDAATYGAIGLALLILGLTMLGLKSLAQGGPFTFDFVKNRFHASQSAIASKLAVLTSRDVYAALFAITFVVGLAEWMLLAFAVAAGVWLATITVVLLTAKEQPN
jgi:CDP-L-myo-inositol myo-inositolphosphotransferase